MDKFLGRDWLGGMESIVCCATLSLSQEEGYVIVDGTSAKMEGRNMMVNGYDALVEVYCVLLLERRDVSELHVLSEQAWFLCYKTTIGSSPDTRRWKYEFDS